MRSPWLAAPLVALALTVGCGGDDDASEDTTTTSTTVGASTAPPHKATANDLARVILQIDEHLRRSQVDATACIQNRKEQCTGAALNAYVDIGTSAGQMVDILPQLAQKGSSVYQGEFSGELVARLDATVNLGATLRNAWQAAQDACLPDFGAGCEEANAALDAALIEVFKDFNGWRDDYDPATDPANTGGQGGVVVPAD